MEFTSTNNAPLENLVAKAPYTVKPDGTRVYIVQVGESVHKEFIKEWVKLLKLPNLDELEDIHPSSE